jgi:hypothetical protein
VAISAKARTPLQVDKSCHSDLAQYIPEYGEFFPCYSGFFDPDLKNHH